MNSKEYLAIQENVQNKNTEDGLLGLKLALDVWGLEPTTGWIGDLASGAISLGQALHKAITKKPGASSHLADAAISLVSTIPFADVVKLLKLKHGSKYAELATKLAKPLQNASKRNKYNMMQNRAVNTVKPQQQPQQPS